MFRAGDTIIFGQIESIKKEKNTGFLLGIISDVRDNFAQNRIEWLVVCFGAGISIYFFLWFEPYLAVLFIGFCLLFLIWIKFRLGWVLLLLLVFTGLGRASLHTHMVRAPILPDIERTYQITGWVEKVERAGALQSFTINITDMRWIESNKSPKKVRIRLKPYGIGVGDGVVLRANLKAPPIPASIGGYDMGRDAFFRQIGGFGYAVSKVQPANIKLTGLDNMRRGLVKFRAKLSDKIIAAAPKNTAGLQSALLTGKRAFIPKQQEEVLRDAGLAHILAISGLHMGILAGGVYFLLSWLWAGGVWGRKYDMRKWAALGAIIIATIYLLISGAAIATQRAYIMAIVFFMAVILSRRAISVRSVAVAAFIVLFLHPESILSAGFHLSFSATLALVVVYRFWADRRVYSDKPKSKIKEYISGLVMTSAIAGIATGAFAALHFQRFARLGFFANLVAMPVFGFLVMPFGFLALALMPFGLEEYPLLIMGKGLEIILATSEYIASFDMAVMHIKAANSLVLSVFGLGFIALCLGGKIIRYIGALFTGFAFVIWWALPVADMRISDDARIAFWDKDEVLQVDKKRGDGFGRASFVQQAGRKGAKISVFDKNEIACDIQACLLQIKGKNIVIVNRPESVSEACSVADLVVLTNRYAGPRVRRHCKSILLDRGDLMRGGARHVYIKNGQIKIKKTNPASRQNRIWGGLPAGSKIGGDN